MRKSKPTFNKKKVQKSNEASARQGSPYDKIVKENMDKSLITIIQQIGGLPIVKSEPLRTKLQHTKERDPDELSTVWLADGTKKVLHAEVHLKDEDDINYRLCEYYAMLKRRNSKLDLIQYVIYIGEETPKHITGFWKTDVLSFRYNVIIFKDIPYKVFLESDNPETVVLAILANFQDAKPELVGVEIANRIKKLSQTDSEKEKFYTQLRVLSNVRKLRQIIDKIMDNIYKMIDISNDPLYSKGKVEGVEEGVEKGVVIGEVRGEARGIIKGIKSWINNSDFSDERIAEIMSVSLETVKKIRNNINSEDFDNF
jgi:predicted transposase YdaD